MEKNMPNPEDCIKCLNAKLEDEAFELAEQEKLPYANFFNIRDGCFWRTRAILAEAEIVRLRADVEQLRAAIKAIRANKYLSPDDDFLARKALENRT
jgi:hypothetical protein